MFLKVREYRFIVDLFPNNTGFDTIANNLVFVWVYIQYTPPPSFQNATTLRPPKPKLSHFKYM